MFGTEIPVGQEFSFKGQKIAVFTWHGATIRVKGKPEVAYQESDTPMATYLNAHGILEARRQRAKESTGKEQELQGPRVLLAGPVDVGKSSVSKILINYAVKKGWAPVMVDLDIGQGNLTVPGTISAVPVEAPIDILRGYPQEIPLVYQFGHTSPTENAEHYKYLVKRVAEVLDARCKASEHARCSGMVINTMGWVEGLGYALLLDAAMTLKVDVILVVGQERLYSVLKAEQSLKGKEIVKLPKSGGVVTRDRDYRQKSRQMRIKEYFYGHEEEFMPHSQSVPIEALKAYRLLKKQSASDHALPVGQVAEHKTLTVAPMDSTKDLMHTILAVSHASTVEEIAAENVAGFIYVSDIDPTNNRLTYLAPCPGPLPGKYLLGGTLKAYFE